MIDPRALRALAETLDDALTNVGNELDDLREYLGRAPDQLGKGALVDAFAVVDELCQLADSTTGA